MKYLGPPQSGSQADTTASHNRAGQYYRNRRSPVQPVGSGRRAFVRAAFGSASTNWASLAAVDQAAWASFAAGHPITDSLGQSIVLTGQQMYVRVNTSLLNVGEPLTPTVPASTALPDVTAATFVFDNVTGASIAGFTGGASDFVVAAFSRPVSAGIGFMKTFWQPLGAAGYIDAASAPYLLALAPYATEFGVVVVGQKIFVRLTPVNQFGWNGTPVIISVLVT